MDILLEEKVKSDIERLCTYIPYFETATKQSVCEWRGGGKIGDNLYEMSYPNYDETLIDFTEDVYKSSLMCKDYLDIINLHSIYDDDKMITALDNDDLVITSAILTFYIRQERFCDGLWAVAVDKKIFLKILKRLKKVIDIQ
ncbi:MAG: DUF6508 domain-containing protein [Sedimentibacter sp.]|uniref:DUF6508 domain-containing protein n=1 Tax=Sedimentibacter sp. TaxID=1960295 RepID=UPI002980DCA9|nr:DUF6508 domain-containing protein [Sedimentibacter sp.]MDW5300142.1 DUF6508 domain-containing protein [Sedimentibacter sp.]